MMSSSHAHLCRNQGHDIRLTDLQTQASWIPRSSDSVLWGPQARLPTIANDQESSPAWILMKNIESKVTSLLILQQMIIMKIFLIFSEGLGKLFHAQGSCFLFNLPWFINQDVMMSMNQARHFLLRPGYLTEFFKSCWLLLFSPCIS